VPVLDFTEIAKATAGANRDDFELFAREFLQFLKFKPLSGPDRGADGGRDLIVEETRTGVGGETRVKWLVSCKHKAHSGNSVTPGDEPDIHDRVRTHSCSGFLCVYSTIPSSGLAKKLEAATEFETLVYDREAIEARLLASSDGVKLAERFFPASIQRWKTENPSPAKIFDEEPELLCEYCGKSLLGPKPGGIVVLWRTERDEHGVRRTEHFYWCCKGHCDRQLEAQYGRPGLTSGWRDVADFVIPTLYIQWVIGTLNRLRGGESYSDAAHDKSKRLLLNVFPLVCRHLPAAEVQEVKNLMMMPRVLGGLGE